MATVKMRLMLASDVHTEFVRNFDDLPAEVRELSPPANTDESVPVGLILAGDFSQPWREDYGRLLEGYSTRFDHVFVVLGNHEFYGHGYWWVRRLARAQCARWDNVHLLDGGDMGETAVRLECGVRVVGCTLWGHVPDTGEETIENPALRVAMMLNDYKMIKWRDLEEDRRRWADDGRDVDVDRVIAHHSEMDAGGSARSKADMWPHAYTWLTTKHTNAMHERECLYLDAQVAEARACGETVVVVTHHAPLEVGTSDTQYTVASNPIRFAFASDQFHRCGAPVALWAFGHTHFSSRQQVRGTQVVSNQRGYVTEPEHARAGVGYQANAVFDVCEFSAGAGAGPQSGDARTGDEADVFRIVEEDHEEDGGGTDGKSHKCAVQ